MIGLDTIGTIVRQRMWRELLSLGTGKGQVWEPALTRKPKGWKSIGEPWIELADRSADFGPPRPVTSPQNFLALVCVVWGWAYSISCLNQFRNRSRHLATGRGNNGRTGSSSVRGDISEPVLFTVVQFSRSPAKMTVFLPDYD